MSRAEHHVGTSEPLTGVRTLQQYAEWLKGLLTLMPDERYADIRGAQYQEGAICALNRKHLRRRIKVPMHREGV